MNTKYLGLIALIGCLSFSLTYGDSPRHIVFALLDDIGYADISATGGQFPTPNIDKLREHSIILNRHYIHYKCSPSRTQFMTGRRSLNLGFGQLLTWPYTSTGGIPVGQPTLANWYRDFKSENIPKYSTYGIGKWHIGYAADLHLPHSKGFDHFYGFYQGGMDYITKEHPKSHFDFGSTALHGIDGYIQHPNELHYDFWEDGEPQYEVLASDKNIMYFYQDKITHYLDDFVENKESEIDSLYLYLGVQTLHGPFQTAPEKTEQCNSILNGVTSHFNADNEDRMRLCEYTLLTDDYFKHLIAELKSHNLWDDTLLIFTGDNGGNIDMSNCNYPLRGTKSTYFDGNIRQLTFVTGGKNIIPSSQYGTMRQILSSNLDWTPTLLSYSGILPYIPPESYTWDGIDIWDIILNGDDTEKERDQLLINIQIEDELPLNKMDDLKDYNTMSILFYYGDDRHLYKYIVADYNEVRKSGTDYQWIHHQTDGWCQLNDDGSIYVEKVEDSDDNQDAMILDKQFLFDLTNDKSERYNLMREWNENELNKILDHIADIMVDELTLSDIKDYYHSPIHCLHDYNQLGDPNRFFIETPVQGCIISPFLDNDQYFDFIKNCFDNVDDMDHKAIIPDSLRDLYFNQWISPNPYSSLSAASKTHIDRGVFIICSCMFILIVLMVLCRNKFAVIAMVGNKGESMPLLT